MSKRPTIMLDEFARNIMYKKHRWQVKNSRSWLDMTPKPIVGPSVTLLHKLKSDAVRLREINNKNKEMLRKIIQMQSKTSVAKVADNPSKRRTSSTRMNIARARLREIEKSNLTFGNKLLNIKSTLNTRSNIEASPEEHEETFEIPQETLDAYSYFVLPSELDLLAHLLRPQIFLDLEVHGAQSLGRITMQLFTEACPEVVLEFVRICTENNRGAFQFIRIFSSLWVEGELTFMTAPLRVAGFEYDENILDHAYGPGILSFARCYLDGFPNGMINFSIGFKPLPLAQSERIAFGIVTRGHRSLDCLQDYGTKSGKAKKLVTVNKCGVV